MDLNKVMLIGRLTREPELKSTPTGSNVATFSIATNLVWTDQGGQKQEKVEFHNLVAWRRLADICGQYLKKGAKIYAEGRLQTRDWVGQDGVKRYRTEVVMDNMIMLDRVGATNNGGSYSQDAPPSPMNEPMMSDNSSIQNDPGIEEDEIKVENIPF